MTAHLAEVIDLSLSLHAAAREAGLDGLQAQRFVDALVALPGYAAERIVAERRREAVRQEFARRYR